MKKIDEVIKWPPLSVGIIVEIHITFTTKRYENLFLIFLTIATQFHPTFCPWHLGKLSVVHRLNLIKIIAEIFRHFLLAVTSHVGTFG